MPKESCQVENITNCNMGVFKWLRRERVTLTSRRSITDDHDDIVSSPRSDEAIGTIRTEDYKRDLAEFQARRSSGGRELSVTPTKRRCGKHNRSVSCTDCATPTSERDNTFNYEKKSATKYKKNKSQKRSRSASQEVYEAVPNVQFLFQNQVFMPGNVFQQPTYSEPYKKTNSREKERRRTEIQDNYAPKSIDFRDNVISPPFFYKNNSLPVDPLNFLEGCGSEEEVDGDFKAAQKSSPSSYSNKDDSSGRKMVEVMRELNSFDKWADDQLMNGQSLGSSRVDDNKSEASANGLPVVTASDLDVTIDRNRTWNFGTWGAVPVQIKRLTEVTIEHLKKKINLEVNILRKCRHPNIILLMAVFPDVYGNVYIVCERCVDSLYAVIHVRGRILSAQTSVQYASDVANALVFLRMRGFLHTALTSHSVMLTDRGTAKLADFGPCAVLPQIRHLDDEADKGYLTENHYVNIGDVRGSKGLDSEPLISKNPSSVYLTNNSVAKEYKAYAQSEYYRWQAPELFEPDDCGLVHVCSKSDVYSLSLILWECCNALVPWKTMTYDKLKELYLLWRSGIRIPTDGTYPGCLLELLQHGLTLERGERPHLQSFADRLKKVKQKLDSMEYIVIPARLSRKQSDFSSKAWDTSPSNSECQSPPANKAYHKPMNKTPSSTNSSRSDAIYETIHSDLPKLSNPQKHFIQDDDVLTLKYESMKDKDFSSNCSTPIAKVKAKIIDKITPLQKNDSTEYYSILSPEYQTPNVTQNSCENKDENGVEKVTTKLTRSLTPMSYKPLHIKVPDLNMDTLNLKSFSADQGTKPRCTFDVRNYSLPNTPIARSNKLRKNAWLSGELDEEKENATSQECASKEVKYVPKMRVMTNHFPVMETVERDWTKFDTKIQERTPDSGDVVPNFTQQKINETKQEQSPNFDRARSWSFRSSERSPRKYRVEEEVLSAVNVKPLVAIHERWIHEANKKTTRSLSLPEDNRSNVQAVKPASHCDTLQTSHQTTNGKRGGNKFFKNGIFSANRNGRSEQYNAARDHIARCMTFSYRDRRDSSTSTTSTIAPINNSEKKAETKVDQTTDTDSIEDFIRDLIKKEFQHLLQEISIEECHDKVRKEEALTKGIKNVIENLTNGCEEQAKLDSTRSYSKLKINGNNKPLLQITFNKGGENSLHVLDNSVNVTIAEKKTEAQEDGLNDSILSVKRCQTYGAMQEARSTEDLYIDDDLSTQMQENFGGKVKLIPLHGSLHEILCEKEDDCCLIKVKQENGCDSIYFRCDNSDTESRDAIDGATEETVVYKRSISLIEEKIHRVPKKKPTITRQVLTTAGNPVTFQERNTKKDIPFYSRRLNNKTRMLSISSPTLNTIEDDIEMNIDRAICYEDSSSDECVKVCTDDEFEFIEKEIEKSVNDSSGASNFKYLEKISEESLSVIDDSYEKNVHFEFDNKTI